MLLKTTKKIMFLTLQYIEPTEALKVSSKARK